MSTSQLQPRTQMLARVLGPFTVIVCITAVARASDMSALLSQFEANSLWTWVAGAFVLVFGLIMVAAHQYWRGAAAIIVSLFGWLITLRGLMLLAFPKAFVSLANAMMDAQGLWVALCIAFAVVGLYLTYVGWMSAPDQPAPQTERSAKDLPRAA
ncbi:hypothetical protein [Mycobacterium spongiae]|uniref:Uncharacterized protein n=1 Tax=Mycobacterium spongiae TaxID=886343 RepID=A0A975K0Z6_9MYCO|nr:hypothetical protein [Mycobacterium spongiae]QUR69369.1 hypothetical protein F6B93_21905 [Mycobacterium spongiae]